jgi:hypothetical protein
MTVQLVLGVVPAPPPKRGIEAAEEALETGQKRAQGF